MPQHADKVPALQPKIAPAGEVRAERGRVFAELASPEKSNPHSPRLGHHFANIATHAPGNPRGSPVQRLIVDADANLYAPTSWLETEFDDRSGEKVRDVAIGWEKASERSQLTANIKSISGVEVGEFKEVTPSANAVRVLGEAKAVTFAKDQFTALPNGGAAQAARIKTEFANALDQRTTIYVVPDNTTIIPTTAVAALAKHLLTDPKGLVMSPSDLTGGYDIKKACALIAIYASEKNDLSALRSKIKAGPGVKSALEFYVALHDYYYTTEGIEYTEPATHAALYRDYGYTLIFAGNTTFANLPDKLGKSLVKGKKYILDIKGHTVFATMQKNMAPGQALVGASASYFDFKSDSTNNFDKGETNFNVENIYEK